MSFYSGLLERVLLPAYDAARGRNYTRHRKFLEQSQWWPTDRLLQFQWDELQALLDHVFANEYYRQKYAEAGIGRQDIRSWEDFRRLPVLTREEAERHRDRIRSPLYRGPVHRHATGGSSGAPLHFYRTTDSYDWRSAATDRAYSWSGSRPGLRTLYLWGAPVGAQPRLNRGKTQLHNALLRRTILATFSQTQELWERAWSELVSWRPEFIVGYASSVLQFARFVEDRNLKATGVRAVLTGADPLSDNARAFIRTVLGAPVFNTYGAREFMSVACECDRNCGFHVNVENVVVETEDAAAVSRILITDLHNFGTLFVRYAIGDMGRMSSRVCSCGRGLPLLESIEGRTHDLITLANGRTLSHLFFPHLLKEVPEVLEYQVEQRAPDHLCVSVVAPRPVPPASRALVEEELRKVCGPAIRIELREVATIPKSASGKHQPVISL